MSEAIAKPPADLVKGWEEVRHCAQLIREGKARIVVTKKNGKEYRYTKPLGWRCADDFKR